MIISQNNYLDNFKNVRNLNHPKLRIKFPTILLVLLRCPFLTPLQDLLKVAFHPAWALLTITTYHSKSEKSSHLYNCPFNRTDGK